MYRCEMSCHTSGTKKKDYEKDSETHGSHTEHGGCGKGMLYAWILTFGLLAFLYLLKR